MLTVFVYVAVESENEIDYSEDCGLETFELTMRNADEMVYGLGA